MITIVDLIRREGREPGGGRAKVEMAVPPLMEFVYTTLPGQYDKNYKFVRHVELIDAIKNPHRIYHFADIPMPTVKRPKA